MQITKRQFVCKECGKITSTTDDRIIQIGMCREDQIKKLVEVIANG